MLDIVFESYSHLRLMMRCEEQSGLPPVRYHIISDLFLDIKSSVQSMANTTGTYDRYIIKLNSKQPCLLQHTFGVSTAAPASMNNFISSLSRRRAARCKTESFTGSFTYLIWASVSCIRSSLQTFTLPASIAAKRGMLPSYKIKCIILTLVSTCIYNIMNRQ